MSHLALATEVAGPPAIVTFDGEHVPAASMNRAIFVMPGPIGWGFGLAFSTRGARMSADGAVQRDEGELSSLPTFLSSDRRGAANRSACTSIPASISQALSVSEVRKCPSYGSLQKEIWSIYVNSAPKKAWRSFNGVREQVGGRRLEAQDCYALTCLHLK